MKSDHVTHLTLMSFFNFFDNYLPLSNVEIKSILGVDEDWVLACREMAFRDALGTSVISSDLSETIRLIADAEGILNRAVQLYGLPSARRLGLIDIIDGNTGSIERMIKSGRLDLIKKAIFMMSEDYRCRYPQETDRSIFNEVFGDIFAGNRAVNG